MIYWKPFLKKSQVFRVRFTEQMAELVRESAEIDDRDYDHHIRHLLKLGLDVWEQRNRERLTAIFKKASGL
jgi:hypothetical protein